MVRNAKVLSAKGVIRLAEASFSFAMAFGIIMGAVTPILGEKKAAALLCYTVKEEK